MSDMKAHVHAALRRGFHVFATRPMSKIPLPGSHGFKDACTGPEALKPWTMWPTANPAVSTGASNLTVLDFDSGNDIPSYLMNIPTYKVATARGAHLYFSGARRSGKLVIDGQVVGDCKSEGAYVMAAGALHPSGARYVVFDASPVAPFPPQAETLIVASRVSGEVNASADGEPIPYGEHSNYLYRVAAALRGLGLNEEELVWNLTRICERRCVGKGSDWQDMVRKTAASACRHRAGDRIPLPLFG